MDGARKEWWYKDKMVGVSKKRYFCLFQPYILTINYRCLEDLLLIGPKTQFSQVLIPDLSFSPLSLPSFIYLLVLSVCPFLKTSRWPRFHGA